MAGDVAQRVGAAQPGTRITHQGADRRHPNGAGGQVAEHRRRHRRDGQVGYQVVQPRPQRGRVEGHQGDGVGQVLLGADRDGAVGGAGELHRPGGQRQLRGRAEGAGVEVEPARHAERPGQGQLRGGFEADDQRHVVEAQPQRKFGQRDRQGAGVESAQVEVGRVGVAQGVTQPPDQGGTPVGEGADRHGGQVDQTLNGRPRPLGGGDGGAGRLEQGEHPLRCGSGGGLAQFGEHGVQRVTQGLVTQFDRVTDGGRVERGVHQPQPGPNADAADAHLGAGRAGRGRCRRSGRRDGHPGFDQAHPRLQRPLRQYARADQPAVGPVGGGAQAERGGGPRRVGGAGHQPQPGQVDAGVGGERDVVVAAVRGAQAQPQAETEVGGRRAGGE